MALLIFASVCVTTPTRLTHTRYSRSCLTTLHIGSIPAVPGSDVLSVPRVVPTTPPSPGLPDRDRLVYHCSGSSSFTVTRCLPTYLRLTVVIVLQQQGRGTRRGINWFSLPAVYLARVPFTVYVCGRFSPRINARTARTPADYLPPPTRTIFVRFPHHTYAIHLYYHLDFTGLLPLLPR